MMKNIRVNPTAPAKKTEWVPKYASANPPIAGTIILVLCHATELSATALII